jgi:ferredoxin
VRAESANTDFDVVLAGSGEVVHVAADQSVLLALRGDGVTALSSCAEGLCGTCETPVLEGVPEHRDVVLTDEEKQRGESMRSVYCAARATVSCSTSEPVWRRGSRWAERQAASADCATPTISVWRHRRDQIPADLRSRSAPTVRAVTTSRRGSSRSRRSR